jgi:hypothetical protein
LIAGLTGAVYLLFDEKSSWTLAIYNWSMGILLCASAYLTRRHYVRKLIPDLVVRADEWRANWLEFERAWTKARNTVRNNSALEPEAIVPLIPGLPSIILDYATGSVQRPTPIRGTEMLDASQKDAVQNRIFGLFLKQLLLTEFNGLAGFGHFGGVQTLVVGYMASPTCQAWSTYQVVVTPAGVSITSTDGQTFWFEEGITRSFEYFSADETVLRRLLWRETICPGAEMLVSPIPVILTCFPYFGVVPLTIYAIVKAWQAAPLLWRPLMRYALQEQFLQSLGAKGGESADLVLLKAMRIEYPRKFEIKPSTVVTDEISTVQQMMLRLFQNSGQQNSA